MNCHSESKGMAVRYSTGSQDADDEDECGATHELSSFESGDTETPSPLDSYPYVCYDNDVIMAKCNATSSRSSSAVTLALREGSQHDVTSPKMASSPVNSSPSRTVRVEISPVMAQDCDVEHNKMTSLSTTKDSKQQPQSFNKARMSQSATASHLVDMRLLSHQTYLMPSYRGGDDWTDDDEWRPRVSSMPASIRPPKLAELKQRRAMLEASSKLRSFVITRRGTVQERDSKPSSRAASDNALRKSCTGDSFTSGTSRGWTATCKKQQQQEVTGNDFGDTASVPVYRVKVMGAPCVGKRAIVREFISGNLNIFESSSGDEDSDRRITILLDGEKSTLEFADKLDTTMQESGGAAADAEEEEEEEADAYVVVYSVEDSPSLDTAADMLYELRRRLGLHTPVILVANKTDLVRTRVISEPEGKQMAANYDCKYIEVSAAIDHKVDDLLVGIVKQIRLMKERQLHDRRHSLSPTSRSPSTSPFRRWRAAEKDTATSQNCCPLTGKHSVLRRLFGIYTSKSCDNLYVL